MTQIAIGAQVGGGALGTDTTTLVDFNRSIRDRIIPIKDAPSAPTGTDDDPNKRLSTLTNSLGVLYGYFGDLTAGWWTDGEYNVDEGGKYQGALRDLINFFRALGKSKTKNKSIIPTVLSVEMDGIGGIIIGNIFRINTDILPKGYKNIDGIGAKLGYLVTGLGHTLSNNDWVTKIDAQSINLDEPEGLDINFSSLTITPGGGPLAIAPTVTPAGNVTGVALKGSDDLSKIIINAGYAKDTSLYSLALAIGTKEGWSSKANGGAGSRNYRNNNPGNLDYSNSLKSIDPQVVLENNPYGVSRFAKFSTPELGVKALVENKIKKWANGNMPVTAGNTSLAKPSEKYKKGSAPTIAQFFYTYAPPNENQTELYIAQIISSIKKQGINRDTLVKNII